MSNKKYEMFEMKPCGECPHTCVEGSNKECPYDKIVRLQNKKLNEESNSTD